MVWHGYFAAASLGLSVAQRNTIFADLEAEGTLNASPYPHLRNHWAISTDDAVRIFEGVFADDITSIAAWKVRIGLILLVDDLLIDDSQATPTFDTTPSLDITFTYLLTDYFRVVLLGGASTTIDTSRTEVRAYMADVGTDWN